MHYTHCNEHAFDTSTLACIVVVQDDECRLTVDKHTTAYPDGKLCIDYDITIEEDDYSASIMLNTTQMRALVDEINEVLLADVEDKPDPTDNMDYLLLQKTICTAEFRRYLDVAFHLHAILGQPLNRTLRGAAEVICAKHSLQGMIDSGVMYLRVPGNGADFAATVRIERSASGIAQEDATSITSGYHYFMQLFPGGTDASNAINAAFVGINS